MNIETIVQMMKLANNNSLKYNPMVQELWQDGEVTLTKGGDLFRARNLHMIKSPVVGILDSEKIAEGLGHTGNISIFVNDADCKEIRTAMEQL